MRVLHILAALAAMLVSGPVRAAPTVTTGVGVSGLQVGTVPALAVTPHVEVGWQVGDTLTVATLDSDTPGKWWECTDGSTLTCAKTN